MGVLLPWAIAVGFQVIRDVRKGKPPVPSEFVASGAVFGALAVASQANEQVATVLAWGLLVALYLQVSGKGPLLGPSKPAAGGATGRPKL